MDKLPKFRVNVPIRVPFPTLRWNEIFFVQLSLQLTLSHAPCVKQNMPLDTRIIIISYHIVRL